MNKMFKLCDRYKADLSDAMCWTESYDEKWEVKETICWLCSQLDRMANYLLDEEISSKLMTDAVLCRIHVEENEWKSLHRLRSDVQTFYTAFSKQLVQIARDVDDIHAKGREFEVKHWLPTLRQYYNKSDGRGHCGEGDGWKALMWGSAGRVLLTLSDVKPKGIGKFGGAWITLIFDDSADYARGGIQGLCATKGEALALLQVAIDNLPEMKADKEVRMAGL